ncbi:MAG TPA: Crp/Fnr family transcriptional regulator [Steroidobacteraceae bacterium]
MSRTLTCSGRRGGPAGIPIRNGVLAALLAADYKHILPKLEHVKLTGGRTLYHAEQEIADVYFPEDAVVAMIDTMEDGRTVEVGIIGREGIVGINVFLGGVVTPDKAIVQLSGGAMRMSAKEVRAETRFGSPLQALFLGYAHSLLAATSQSVACSQHHNIEQRLARLLLTLSQHAGSEEFSMVQASLASLLGVRRAGITGAAGGLQARGLITYQRGRITVLDRRALEMTSCECYRVIQRSYTRVQRRLPRA